MVFSEANVDNSDKTTYSPLVGVYPQWYNVITYGTTLRCTQIAINAYDTGGIPRGTIFVRTQHDSVISGWVRYATNADLHWKTYSGVEQLGITKTEATLDNIANLIGDNAIIEFAAWHDSFAAFPFASASQRHIIKIISGDANGYIYAEDHDITENKLYTKSYAGSSWSGWSEK